MARKITIKDRVKHFTNIHCLPFDNDLVSRISADIRLRLIGKGKIYQQIRGVTDDQIGDVQISGAMVQCVDSIITDVLGVTKTVPIKLGLKLFREKKVMVMCTTYSRIKRACKRRGVDLPDEETRRDIGGLVHEIFFSKPKGERGYYFRALHRSKEGEFSVLFYPPSFVRTIDSVVYNYLFRPSKEIEYEKPEPKKRRKQRVLGG